MSVLVKVILFVVVASVGCLLVKISWWFIIVPILILLLFDLATTDGNITKIVIPIIIIFLVITFIIKVFSGPSNEELLKRLTESKNNLSAYEKAETDTRTKLQRAKKEQGWFRDTFWDTENVDNLQKQLSDLKSSITTTKKNIQNTENKLAE